MKEIRMGDYLRIGALSDDWTSTSTVSMAREIEAELEKLIGPLPPDDKPEPRRRLAIAIATGVINHLANNADAFTIQIPRIPGPTVAAHPVIKVQP
jgi:hypothetical protein